MQSHGTFPRGLGVHAGRAGSRRSCDIILEHQEPLQYRRGKEEMVTLAPFPAASAGEQCGFYGIKT